MKTDFNPFLDHAPKEVPLTDSPLVRVIAQVSFPAQLGLIERPTISEIQKAIGTDFPVLEEQNLKSFVFNLAMGGGEGILQPQTSPETQWRFSHPETGFVLQINSSSITFETSRYTSRTDFFSRFLVCLKEIHKLVPIQFANRLGVRYVDRVSGDRCKSIQKMICLPFRGISGLPFEVPAMSDLHDFLVPLELENGALHGRMGFLPPGGTTDPTVLPPLGDSTWVLDLDLFRQGPQLFSFDPDSLAKDASKFALRIYSVFRWVVGDDFLREFGGKP